MANSTVSILGSSLGTPFETLLNADCIEPGSDPSYQLCKLIFLYHPLGAKIAEAPIRKAMSQKREVSVPSSPEDMVVKQFKKVWEELGVNTAIFNTMTQSRIYGIASVAVHIEGQKTDTAIDLTSIGDKSVTFNVLDPLNTAGSLVMVQDPNLPDYQKPNEISVSGQKYHPSRSCIMMNEQPIYIAYTTSAFGFVGRSAYQRALYPLKSFVQSMRTDDMVTLKAGLLIACMKAAGSIIDNVMRMAGAIKRNLLKEGQTGNVLQVGQDDKIETLNMMNADNAMTTARKNILENIAVAVPMPAKMINSETFAEGFGEGTEDAKEVASYIDGVRETMAPLYAFFDNIVQHKAWDESFFDRVKTMFPDMYKGKEYNTVFYDWKNSFSAEWPSLLIEPDSEKVKVEDIKLKAVLSFLEIMLPQCDPENKTRIIEWAADNFNDLTLMFPNPLELDYVALANFVPLPPPMMGDGDDPKPERL